MITPDLLGDRAPRSHSDPAEIQRYARHLIMPEVAMEGQKRLKAAKVLCIGTGGLGSPLSLYLAAAGRRHDRPGRFRRGRRLEPPAPDHPLHRRRRPAQDRQRRGEAPGDQPRPDVRPPRASRSTARNALEIFAGYDVIVDGTDNFPTRYLVNDACVLLGKPNVYGSIFRFDGQASVFFPPHGPCYRCLYPEPPPPDLVPNCAEGGVLGILPGLIGVVQATETVKLILGDRPPADRPAAALRCPRHDLPRDEGPQEPEVPDLRDRTRRSRGLIDYQEFCGVRGAETAPRADGTPGDEITPLELKALLDRGDAAVHPRRPQPRGDRDLPDRRLDRDPPARAARPPRRARPDACRWSSTARAASAAPRRSRCSQAAGFTRLTNLTGGILAWIKDVDPSLPTY